MTATMQATDRQIWSGMLEHLRVHKPDLCRQWFEEIEPLGIASGQLRLRAHSNIHREYLRRECIASFNDAACSVSQRLLAVQFFGPDDEVERTTDDGSAPSASGFVEPSARRAGPRPAQNEAVRVARPAVNWPLTSASKNRFDQLSINPDYAFDNFVRGPNNQLAHAAALGVAGNPGRAYNPYFVHGGVGLGKTHLLQAICLKVQSEIPDARIHYTSCEAFMTQFIDAVQEGEMTAFRHRFRDVDMLVIDDIHFLAKRDRTQEEFFHTFNSLYQAHKQIVLSSDAAPEDIPDLEDRLVSRFKWGLVTEVTPPDYETRIEIVKQKARLRGLTIPPEVAAHIAGRIDSNIRELEGAVVKIQAVANMDKRPIDLALAAAALGDNPQKADKQVQIQSIITAVTDFYGVKITDLQSKRRQRSIALPRQVCMFLARRHTRFSLEEIGGYFGGRDHTTVMHAVKTVEGRCDVDTDFAKVMATLETQLKSQMAV